MSAVGRVVDAVAEVCDTPVDMGKDRGVETEDVSIGEVVGVFEAGGGSAVSRDAEDKFTVRLQRNDREFYCGSRADEATVDVAGEIAASIDGEVDGADVKQAVIEAEGPGHGPILVGESAFFAADGTVDGELGLSVAVDGVEAEQEEGEAPENSAVHA